MSTTLVGLFIGLLLIVVAIIIVALVVLEDPADQDQS